MINLTNLKAKAENLGQKAAIQVGLAKKPTTLTGDVPFTNPGHFNVTVMKPSGPSPSCSVDESTGIVLSSIRRPFRKSPTFKPTQREELFWDAEKTAENDARMEAHTDFEHLNPDYKNVAMTPSQERAFKTYQAGRIAQDEALILAQRKRGYLGKQQAYVHASSTSPVASHTASVERETKIRAEEWGKGEGYVGRSRDFFGGQSHQAYTTDEREEAAELQEELNRLDSGYIL
jgi:hypothetical protein